MACCYSSLFVRCLCLCGGIFFELIFCICICIEKCHSIATLLHLKCASIHEDQNSLFRWRMEIWKLKWEKKQASNGRLHIISSRSIDANMMIRIVLPNPIIIERTTHSKRSGSSVILLFMRCFQ